MQQRQSDAQRIRAEILQNIRSPGYDLRIHQITPSYVIKPQDALQQIEKNPALRQQIKKDVKDQFITAIDVCAKYLLNRSLNAKYREALKNLRVMPLEKLLYNYEMMCLADKTSSLPPFLQWKPTSSLLNPFLRTAIIERVKLYSPQQYHPESVLSGPETMIYKRLEDGPTTSQLQDRQLRTDFIHLRKYLCNLFGVNEIKKLQTRPPTTGAGQSFTGAGRARLPSDDEHTSPRRRFSPQSWGFFDIFRPISGVGRRHR